MNQNHSINSRQIAVFGGGCFWCTEAIFQRLKGVSAVMPGYTGGKNANPTYEQVSTGATGHVEVIRIEFDATKISFEDLLTVFFATHDPTTLNRQGNDIGTQYRSVIFYTNPEQKTQAETFIKNLNDDDKGKPAVTEVEPLKKFYPAEDYHQQYYLQHQDEPYCQIIINPKLDKLEEKFESLLK